MASEQIETTYSWLRAAGFMKGPEMSTLITVDANEDTIGKRGLADGKAAGSWVLDGNTSKERAREIWQGIEDGDSAILDSLPSLCLGEWADDPSWEDILSDEGIECDDDTADDLWGTYQDAWSEGMLAEVSRAARLAMPMSVKITCSDDDDGMCTVWCDDVEQARHDQSVSLDGQSSNWEFPDGEIAICSLCNFYDLDAALTADGYDVDSSEYSAPDAEDLAYWAYRNDAENDGDTVEDRDAWLLIGTAICDAFCVLVR